MDNRTERRKSFAGPTIFTILGLALLLGLGTWQVQRLHWKEGLIAERAAGVAAPPVPLPRSAAAAQPLEYHHVRVVGRYVGRALYMHALSLDDGAEGYQVIEPFALEGGGTVLIDRGFVPGEGATPAIEPPTPAGETTVTGLLRLAAGKPSWFTPDNAPDRNAWFYVDPASMAKAAGVGSVFAFFIDADRSPAAGSYPIGGQTPLELPNNHLQYAITWYMLAAGLLIVYILLLRKRMREAP